MHHESGYFPIAAHVSYLPKNNVLEVTVSDDTESDIFPRGKQSNDPSGIWYTPTSGIWQSVWIESVPDDGYIKSVKVDPLFDEQKLKIQAEFIGNRAFASVEAYYHGQLVAKGAFDPSGECVLDFHYSFYPWTPDDPNLYELVFTAGYDIVRSYFAMRKFSVVQLGEDHFFALNNKPLFLSGVLDQGYWPESGMTPPSQEAILFDLKLLKKCGFNCVRKHGAFNYDESKLVIGLDHLDIDGFQLYHLLKEKYEVMKTMFSSNLDLLGKVMIPVLISGRKKSVIRSYNIILQFTHSLKLHSGNLVESTASFMQCIFR